jgi:tRNA dimethylallyltransferase
MHYDLITVLGPTAVGKTALAVRLAHRLGSAVLSADSRQVYRGMDIGTGKDLADYVCDGHRVEYYLIDVADAGEHYSVFRYRNDFLPVYNGLRRRQKVPVLCGGSGLYIEAVTRGYALPDVPPDESLRQSLAQQSDAALVSLLQSLKPLHNRTDTESRRRTIRAIEIALYERDNPTAADAGAGIDTLFVGLTLPRELRRERIAQRLHNRLQQGLIEEVSGLLRRGVAAETLLYYGLEYRFITRYLLGEGTYSTLVERLLIAIYQFAKRQMTWFRGMERRGIPIHWIDAAQSLDEQEAIALNIMGSSF